MAILRSFSQPISSVFTLPDKTSTLLKSSLIALCSDVDRYFRINYNLDIFEEVDGSSFILIKETFPNFKKLNLEQFNRLLYTFISIRDLSAHLFLNKKIYIDEDIKEFIKTIVDTPYSLSIGKEITIFGVICVCFLFSHEYQLWTFVTTVIRHTVFIEIGKTELGSKQVDFLIKYKVLCGLGKPSLPKIYGFINKNDIGFFVEGTKKTLTKLIFDFERDAYKNQRMTQNAPVIRDLLKKYPSLQDKPELIERIVKLRNLWLHGYRLFDHIKNKDEEFDFDFEYLFNILIDIKGAFLNKKQSHTILEDIHDCGDKMLDFYTLRNIELTYKIIDSNLFESSKMEQRVKNTVSSYERAMVVEPWFYSKTKALMRSEIKSWYLQKNKFSDCIEREYKGERIDIFEFSSKNGFDIGEEHIDLSEMILTSIDCPIERQLKINGKYLEEYKENVREHYGIFDIYTINL